MAYNLGNFMRTLAMLLPLSERGSLIDYVLGAVNYRSLHADEALTKQVISRADLL